MNTKPLLDLIGKIEAHGNYNAKFSQVDATEDLSQFTVNEVLRKQYRWGRSTGSSAFGKYQFIRKTLASLLDDLDIPGDTYFTPELQDQLAEELLERRGLSKWAAGRMSDERFMDSLSKEWASLPYHTGRSYYAGDGLNKSLTSRGQVRAVLQQVKAPKPTRDCTDLVLRKTSVPVRDRCVEVLQRALNEWLNENDGFQFGPLLVDGVFGPVTEERIKDFQRYFGLKVDGVVGGRTWAELEDHV